MSAAALRAELAARFGAFSLQVSLVVEPGTLALAGPSGSGKTSLLKLLLGALRPTSGRIELAGRVLFDHAQGIDSAPELRGFGYVPQHYALFPHLSALENVAFALGPQVPRAIQRERAHALLDIFGLGAISEAKPRTLSGGERQRVALARALATQPGALLLDEPLAALDSTTRRDVRATLGARLATWGLPVLCVTHDARDAAALAERTAVLEAGRIVQIGTLAELRARPATAFVEEFAGG